jgi:hypothetical protein
MSNIPITIHSPCVTTPDEHVHVKPGDKVRWHADHAEFYLLKLPGGFFVGQPDPFELLVFGTNWTEYFVVADNPGDTAINYINSLSGNCLLKLADGPPDIIIDSSIQHPKKPAAKRNAKTEK